MTTRNVMSRAAALKLAGERRRKLHQERGEQDKRIETATAETMVALQMCADAERALEVAQGEAGDAVRRILAEDVSVDRAAELLELDASEVRRLLKASSTDAEQSGSAAGPSGGAGSGADDGAVTPLPGSGGNDDATRRAS